MMVWSSVVMVVALALLPSTLALPGFVAMIPNLGTVTGGVGNMDSLVPAPFGVENSTCQSIGHVAQCTGAPSGGGNSFGRAFNAVKSWSTVCTADSDGDGLTNGEELGDPRCVWTSGQTPERTTGLSHPGFSCSTTSNPFCLSGQSALTSVPGIVLLALAVVALLLH
eukprot:scpid90048/ scgid8889/ Temptin